MMRLVLVLLLGILAWKVFDHHRSSRERMAESARIAALPVAPYAEALRTEATALGAASAYRCDGRTMCSQMHSCDEAKFFLKNCPDVKMDGNHDGTPCEQQWCH